MINVVLDDLAFVAADAVLRAADDHLAPVTPSMTRLDRQAGPAFVTQIHTKTALPRGAAVVTGGGELAAPFVVHVVVQDAEGMPGRAEIRRALASAWQQAREWGLAHVAAPLIGMGPGQLGPEEAAELLVDTFRQQASGDAAPSSLTVVVERDDERDAVAGLLQRRPS